MATRRRPIHSTNSTLNFRPPTNDAKQEMKGTKPTIAPTSVKEIFMLMVLYVCKKSLFFDTNLKVGIYLGALFLISLIADVATIPKTYLSRSDNAFNQYFVKFAWGWNLIVLVPYIVFTSYIYCCGKIDAIIKHHVSRLFIATFFWWFWTSFFNIIEANYGKCSVRGEQFNSKGACLKNGHYWNGFDVSGHSFILIYGSLVLIEETRSMINWDSIKEYIRTEEHRRATKDNETQNPLKNLTNDQLKILQINYEKYTPFIRAIFIVITIFQLLWDIMLVSTMLYYHIMIEKFLGGAVAVLTWFFTYRTWYTMPKLLPKLPGEGLFKYIKGKTTSVLQQGNVRKRTNSIVNGNQPMFMGRPIYGYKVEGESQQQEDNR